MKMGYTNAFGGFHEEDKKHVVGTEPKKRID